MRRFAEDTSVPVARSKVAIEAMLREHGATEFATGWDTTHDRLQFHLHGSLIRFVLPRPDPKDKTICRDRKGFLRTPAQVQSVIEQRDRQRWRALFLVVKAKIEAVEAGIAVFEQEFLAFIVGPGGMTVGDILVPRLQQGTMWPALPPGAVDAGE